MSPTLPERFDSLIEQLENTIANPAKFPKTAIRLENIRFQLQRWHDDLTFQGTSAEREMRELSGRDIMKILDRRDISLAEKLGEIFDYMLEGIRSIQQHYQATRKSNSVDDVVAFLARDLELSLARLMAEKKAIQSAISLTSLSDRIEALHQDEGLSDEAPSLLCLDGGGVRSYSSILIIKALMDEVRSIMKEKILSSNVSREQQPNELRVKDIFQYVVGSSSGGLIAIMLGRLHMFEDQCCHSYKAYTNEILANPNWRYRILGGRIGTKYNGKRLTKATRYLVGDFDPSPEHMKWRRSLFAAADGGCKTAVIAQGEYGRPHTFRSYDVTSSFNSSVKTHRADTCQVWEAARATSAAPDYFAPIEIEGTRFIDGAFGTNNPIWEGLREATYPYGGIPPRLLVVSIGSGLDSPRSGSGSLKSRSSLLLETGKLIVTDTERDHDKMMLISRDERISYFRFNVDHGLQEVLLDSWNFRGKKDKKINKTIEQIEKATNIYLSKMDIKRKLRECAGRIVDGTSSQTPIESLPRSKLVFEVPWKREGIIGRDETLERVTRAAKKRKVVALAGKGGVGKTHIAVEYCYQLRDQQERINVIWTDASTPASFAMSCTMVAERRRLPGYTPHPTNGIKRIHDWLIKEPQKMVLFVYDNFYDSEEYPAQSEQAYPWKLFSNLANVSLLITTRQNRSFLEERFTTSYIDVDALQTDQSKRLLLHGHVLESSDDKGHASDFLLRFFDSLPLSLKLAAAFMHRRQKTPSDYVEMLLTVGSRYDHGLDDTRSFFSALHLALAKLTTAARDFLYFLAVLERHALSPDFLGPGIKSMINVDDTIRELEAYSLICPDRSNMTWRAHDLIRKSVRVYMRDEGVFEKWSETALRFLDQNFLKPSDNNVVASYDLYPHILHVIEHPFKSLECKRVVANLLARMALYDARQDAYEAAGIRLRRAVSILKVLENDVTQTSVDALLRSQANLAERTVEKLLKYYFEIREKTPEHILLDDTGSTSELKAQQKTLGESLKTISRSRRDDSAISA